MTHERRTYSAAVFLLVVIGLVLWSIAPAEAGTAIKDNPSGVGVNYANYTPSPPPIQGNWQNFHVVLPTNHAITCDTRGKWGNLSQRGFVQLQQTGGNNCMWGGVTMTTFWTNPFNGTSGIETTYYGNYCVGNPGSATVTNCVQLPDGSIWLQRTVPAGWTDQIVQADLITCTAVSNIVLDHWQCEHDTWKIQF